MTEVERQLRLGWEPQSLSIELRLADLMVDLDPRWEDWTGLEAAAS